MTKRWAVAVMLCVLALGAGHGPERRTLCRGFLPENDLKIPVGDLAAQGIDEATFNQVLDRAEAFYKPLIAERGATLVVNRRWTDATVNASANQSGKNWHINMFGGLARHKAVTADGFMLVVCHELGHHIGGYPKKWGWATNEGGADYYSTLKCLRHMLSQDAMGTVDAVAKEGCANAFPEGPDRNLCENGAMAGVSVSSLLAELRGSKLPLLATPDLTVVTRTNDAHPAPQCRLDTYYQAALCTKPLSEEVSDKDYAAGACTTEAGFDRGVRPLCWFTPPAPAPVPAPAPTMASRLKGLDEKALRARLEAMGVALSGHGI